MWAPVLPYSFRQCIRCSYKAVHHPWLPSHFGCKPPGLLAICGSSTAHIKMPISHFLLNKTPFSTASMHTQKALSVIFHSDHQVVQLENSVNPAEGLSAGAYACKPLMGSEKSGCTKNSIRRNFYSPLAVFLLTIPWCTYLQAHYFSKWPSIAANFAGWFLATPSTTFYGR